MKDQVRRLLAKLTVLALMLMGIYLTAAPPDRAEAAPQYRDPCNCYNADHDRMGITRGTYCDPVC